MYESWRLLSWIELFHFTMWVCAKLFHSVWLFVTPCTVARQALLSMDSPSKNTAVGCHALLQEIFLTQGLNQISYVSCIGRQVLYHWCYPGSSMNVICGKLVLFYLKRQLSVHLLPPLPYAPLPHFSPTFPLMLKTDLCIMLSLQGIKHESGLLG